MRKGEAILGPGKRGESCRNANIRFSLHVHGHIICVQVYSHFYFSLGNCTIKNHNHFSREKYYYREKATLRKLQPKSTGTLYVFVTVYAHGRRLFSNWGRHGSTTISYPQCSLTLMRVCQERCWHRCRERP